MEQQPDAFDVFPDEILVQIFGDMTIPILSAFILTGQRYYDVGYTILLSKMAENSLLDENAKKITLKNIILTLAQRNAPGKVLDITYMNEKGQGARFVSMTGQGGNKVLVPGTTNVIVDNSQLAKYQDIMATEQLLPTQSL